MSSITSAKVLAPVGTAGKLFAFGLDVIRALFKRPFQLREFLQQAWFIASVTIIPTALVAIPFGAVIALQVGGLIKQFGAQSFTGSASVLAVIQQAGPIATADFFGHRRLDPFSRDLCVAQHHFDIAATTEGDDERRDAVIGRAEIPGVHRQHQDLEREQAATDEGEIDDQVALEAEPGERKRREGRPDMDPAKLAFSCRAMPQLVGRLGAVHWQGDVGLGQQAATAAQAIRRSGSLEQTRRRRRP